MSKDAPKLAIRTKSEPLSTKYTVMFDSDIEESSEFHEQFYIMEQAGKDDLVEVCISSLGGSVATISKFQDVVKNSEAHFHAKLHGYGYSAGGALFLLCDTQEVSDLATFMVHSIQTGYGGGTQAIEAHSKMSSKQNRILCEMLYTDFLTPEEIDRICDGAEIWMDATEIRERLENRDQIREARIHEEEVAAAKEMYDVDTYVENAMQDLMEDVSMLDFTKEELLTKLTEAFSKSEDEESEDGEMLVVEFCDGNLTVGEDCYDLVVCNHHTLETVANILEIKFAHNISTEKLRQRVLDFLNEGD